MKKRQILTILLIGIGLTAVQSVFTSVFGGTNSTEDQLTFMSYNIAVSLPEKNGRYDIYVDELVEYIKNKKIDIIGLQEVPQNRRGNDFIKDLIKDLNLSQYPMYGKNADQGDLNIDGIQMGNAILSKYPIIDYDVYKYDAVLGPNIDGKDHHVIQAAKIQLESGSSIRVINHHPHPYLACDEGQVYWDQFTSVLDRYVDEVVFILGDFNFVREARCYSELVDVYKFIDSCDFSYDESCLITTDETIQVGKKEKRPGIAGIDYIFISAPTLTSRHSWTILDSWADHNKENSDHYPVFATFTNAKEASGFPKGTIQWNFLLPGNAEGWHLWDENPNDSQLSVSGGRLRYYIEGLDSYIFSPNDFFFNGTNDQLLRIRYKIDKGGIVPLTIFWITENDPYWGTGDKYEDYNVMADGNWHNVDIAVGKYWGYNKILGFRLDIANSHVSVGSWVEIDWIKIFPYCVPDCENKFFGASDGCGGNCGSPLFDPTP